MADLRGLKLSLTKAKPIEDHSTYRYFIALQYGDVRWEVSKRFSEFDGLLQSLAAANYGSLPRLPSKTLLGSPTDTGAIDARKEQLRIILHDLLLRPDTRTSQQVRSFLAVDSHADTAVRVVRMEALRTYEDPRFGVSGLCAAPGTGLLLISHEDSTHLSRLGRVWSVVEPDELGAMHVWTRTTDGMWKRVFSKTFGIKVRSLCWEESSRQCFVGLEDGQIEIYAVPADSLQPTVMTTLELHHKSPVTYLVASSRRLMSLGFDAAMRVIDVRNRELICGGRLAKRFKSEMDYLSTGHLDDQQDRVFVGTSGGDVFVLDISRNPPIVLHTIEMNAKPVSAMCLAGDMFLVAHADCVAVMSFEGKTLERRITRLGCHRAKHLASDEATILSVEAAPERNLVFGGFSDGSVAVWTSRESEAFLVLRAHTSDVTQLAWVETAPWGPVLLTGGGDGKVVTWSITGSDEDFAFWTPQRVESDDVSLESTVNIASSADMFTSAEPAFGGGADLFRVDNPRVNPQALKGEDESESDDDIVDAFH